MKTSPSHILQTWYHTWHAWACAIYVWYSCTTNPNRCCSACFVWFGDAMYEKTKKPTAFKFNSVWSNKLRIHMYVCCKPHPIAIQRYYYIQQTPLKWHAQTGIRRPNIRTAVLRSNKNDQGLNEVPLQRSMWLQSNTPTAFTSDTHGHSVWFVG